MPINKETEDYISGHLLKISRVEEIEFSDNERLEMARRILNKERGQMDTQEDLPNMEPIEQAEEPIEIPMKCPECRGTGIIEREAGLISWACPTCNGTGEVADAKPDNDGDDLQQGDSGDRVDNQPTGSGVTREPAKPKKPKTKKKTRKARR